jgi:hypothetical protein
MIDQHLDEMCEDYLARLRVALAKADTSECNQIVSQVAEHIAEARAGLERQSEAGVSEILERLGTPEEIAAAALGDRNGDPTRTGKRRPGWVVVAIALVVLAVLGVGVAASVGAFSSSSPPPKTSTGGPPVQSLVVVPNVLGLSQAQAVNVLTSANLSYQVVYSPSATAAPGIVTAQSVPPGAHIVKSARVTLSVSGGQATGSSSTIGTVP